MPSRIRKQVQSKILLLLVFGVALFTIRAAAKLPQANRSPRGSQSSATSSPTDDLQLSYKLDHFTELADSGPGAGQDIYWHKCFVCHNKYQKSAPPLEGLFKLDALVDGSPVNDQTVTRKSRRAAGNACPRHNALGFDIADVVSYLHDRSVASREKICRRIRGIARPKRNGQCRIVFRAGRRVWCELRAGTSREASRCS